MYLTHESFLKKVEKSGSEYWREGKVYRWEYISFVIEEAKKLNPEYIAEAGSSGIPLNSMSDLLDYPEFDLDKTPYLFSDKAVDLFIALQVWEHLNNQTAAFQEVMRISSSAILSFPYKWPEGKGHDNHHVGIDDKKINEWTCGIKPETTKLIKNRMVCIWQF